MGNLGSYQMMTMSAKAVGGPKNLLAIIISSSMLAGSLLTVGVGAIVYAVHHKKKKQEWYETNWKAF